MNYWKYKINIQPRDPWVEILIAELSEVGVDSFEEQEQELTAYFSEGKDNQAIESLVLTLSERNDFKVEVGKELVKQQNWNASWESSFTPVEIDHFCVVKAPFHELDKQFEHELIITPKMSFGTGHHPTTYLMIKAMQKIDFPQKKVLDMGSGTGVLAILASKLQAEYTLGIDIEKWAVENAIENAAENAATVDFKLGSIEQVPKLKFDIILANINRNILVDQLATYAENIRKGGCLLLSGFLKQDKDFMIQIAGSHDFLKVTNYEKDNWVCLMFEKK